MDNNTKDNPTENETQTTKRRHSSTSRTKKKENQKLNPNSPVETKNKFKNIEQMEIEMDSTPTIKKPGQLKQNAVFHWPDWKNTYEPQSEQ